MVAATAGFVAITVAITVFGGVLYGVADRAADDLVDRTPYLESVFGDRVVE
jgi:multicomponent Na+:H+ antiporter subunit D